MTERWRKSSYSGGGQGGDCVEVSSLGTALRDSKNPGGPALRFDDPGAVSRLLEAIKRGEL
jgi:hypothetical protein